MKRLIIRPVLAERCDKIELHGRVMRVAPISDEKSGRPTARCGMLGGMMGVSIHSMPLMFFFVGFVVFFGAFKNSFIGSLNRRSGTRTMMILM